MSEIDNQEPQYGYGRPVNDLVNESKWSTIRAIRDVNLKATDWVIIQAQENDLPVSTKWKEYRQALRDLPESTDNPDDVVWPVKPE